MAVDIDVRTVRADNSKFPGGRLRLITAVDRLRQVSDQPGKLAGLDLFLQLFRIIGLAVQNIYRVLQLLISFVTMRL